MNIKVLDGRTTVNAPPVDVSTCTITTDTQANIATGDTITIDDGLEDPIVFEFRKDSGAVSQSDRVLVDISADVTAANVRDRLITAIGSAKHASKAEYPAKSTSIRVSAATSGNNVALTSLDWLALPQRLGNAKSNANALAVGAWTGSEQGFALGAGSAGQPGLARLDELLAKVRSVLVSGAPTCSIRVWVLDERTTKLWTPLGAGADAYKGYLNQANAAASYLMGSVGSGSPKKIAHTELLAGMSGWTRVYFELVSIDSASTSVDAYLSSLGAFSPTRS